MAKGQGQGVVLGYLKYVLGFDSLAFQQGIGDADKRLKAAQRSLQKTADKFTSVGAIMSVGITAPFTALVSAAIPAARESQQALGQVQAALTSMGDAAGRTLPQLEQQAEALQKLSTFDDDDIMRKVTANLLTFGNVSGSVFDRAQQAAVNLSARLGQDLQSSALQLGKALNDPVKGLTALSRVGVSFTAQQQEQIKAMAAAGDVAGAQGIILGELEKQYGGAAKALRDATPGIESQQAWAEFQETVGAVALKVLPPLTRMLTAVLEGFNNLNPGMQTFIVGATAVVAVIGPIALGVGGMITAFSAALPAIAALGAGFATLGAVVTGTVIPAIGAVLVALSPILLPIAAVTAAVVGVYLAWRNWDKIKPILEAAIMWVINLHNGVKKYLQDKLLAVFNWLGGKLKEVGRWFYELYDKVVGHSYIPDMVDKIGDHMGRLQRNMVEVAKKATGDTAAAFRLLSDEVKPLMERLFPERAAQVRFEADRSLLQNDKSLSDADRAAALVRLNNEKGDWLGGVGSDPLGISAFSSQLEREWDKGAEANDNFARSFESMARDIAGSIQNLNQAIKGGGFLDILGAAVEAGASIYSSFSGGGNFGGFRANGGPVSGGRTYMVGERGPELFTATRSGYIHPNKRNGGGAGGAARIEIVENPMFASRVVGISGDVSIRTTGASNRALAKRQTRRLA